MHRILSYSHIAFNAHDAEKLIDFYCNKIGLKVKFTLTTDGIVEFAHFQEENGIQPTEDDEHFIEFAKNNPGLPMITYLEIAHHQYLELFHIREELRTPPSLAEQYGYQHLALQVEDIHGTYNEMKKKGIVPDTAINRGPDYTWQFWIHDPEGNRIEFMQYTPLSLQN